MTNTELHELIGTSILLIIGAWPIVFRGLRSLDGYGVVRNKRAAVAFIAAGVAMMALSAYCWSLAA